MVERIVPGFVLGEEAFDQIARCAVSARHSVSMMRVANMLCVAESAVALLEAAEAEAEAVEAVETRTVHYPGPPAVLQTALEAGLKVAIGAPEVHDTVTQDAPEADAVVASGGSSAAAVRVAWEAAVAASGAA